MSEYVQYIVVRKDLVEQMGVGKTAAQVAHGSLGVLLEKTIFSDSHMVKEKVEISSDEGIQKWLQGSFTKLVVYVKAKAQLINLAKKLDNENIRIKLIYDNCLTKINFEEENGTTLTCMGVIPLDRGGVPKCLKKLQLLE
jgi:peptidyl-tRNA hydrolase